jgi:hypothetical protein
MRQQPTVATPPLTFAIIAHTPRGRLIWRGLSSRDAAEQRRCEQDLRRYPVCEVMPEALADILGRMYDDDPDVEWDADLLDAIDQILARDGFVQGGAPMPWLRKHARTWPAAAALYEIVNIMHPVDGAEWGAETSQAIEQALVRHGFVPRPKPARRARARR